MLGVADVNAIRAVMGRLNRPDNLNKLPQSFLNDFETALDSNIPNAVNIFVNANMATFNLVQPALTANDMKAFSLAMDQYIPIRNIANQQVRIVNEKLDTFCRQFLTHYNRPDLYSTLFVDKINKTLMKLPSNAFDDTPDASGNSPLKGTIAILAKAFYEVTNTASVDQWQGALSGYLPAAPMLLAIKNRHAEQQPGFALLENRDTKNLATYNLCEYLLNNPAFHDFQKYLNVQNLSYEQILQKITEVYTEYEIEHPLPVRTSSPSI